MENFNFGWSSCGLTIILNLLPIVSFLNFYSKRTTFDSIPAARIFTNYANCLFWFYYGSIIFDNLIRISNLIGAITYFLYIILYLIFEIRKYFFDSFLNFIIIIFGTISTYDFFEHINMDDKLVGKLSLLVSIISSSTKMPYIYRSYKKKNHLMIPVNYAIISFPTYLCWIIYGLIISDKYIIISNLIGIVVSACQLLIYSYYKNKNQIDEVPTNDMDDFKKENNIKERPVKIIYENNY